MIDDCLFCKLAAGDIPATIVRETDRLVAFRDIAPQAPVHVLVVPKGEWCSAADFHAGASAEEIAGFWRAVALVARDLGLEENGYRVLSNMGPDAGQEVGHFHVHIFGGRRLGRMVPGASAA